MRNALKNARFICIAACLVFVAESSTAAPDEGLGISKSCSRHSLPTGVPSDVPPDPHLVAVTSKSPEASAVLGIIYKIEETGAHPYDAVTPNFDGEGLSLGVIQFNFGGAAQDAFKAIDVKVFDVTMPKWGGTFHDAILAKPYQKGIELVKGMQDQVTGTHGKDWVVKPDALKEIQAFLNTNESRNAQDMAVSDIYAAGYGRALQWAHARGQTAPTFREIVTFVDNQVFSGGALGGMWYPQAVAFRKSFVDDGHMIRFISDWVASCPGSGDGFLWGAAEGKADAAAWTKAFPDGTTLSDEQGLLLALGFLKALSAIGPLGNPSQSGIFKAQVIERRGMIALGVGTANGVPWPSAHSPTERAKTSHASTKQGT